MPMTEAQKEWRRKKTRAVHIFFNRESDADILKKIDSLKKDGESFPEYIRQLIRHDIKSGE